MDKVKELEGRTLKTLDREKKFDILAVSNKGVIVKPLSTGKERKVPRSEIDGAYRELASNKEITRMTIEDKFKKWYKSKAVLSALATLLIVSISAVNGETDPAVTILIAVFSSLGLYGRITATTTITK